MIKLLIFDLDGTLVDTSQDITDAVNYALKPFSQRAYSVEETKAMVGSGISKLIESLVLAGDLIHPNPPLEKGGRGDFSAVKIALNRFLEYYTAHLLDNTKPYPGVNETLLKLGDYKKAVISNKREALSKGVLEGLGLSKFFEVVLGSDSVAENKPSPVPVLEVLKRLSVPKQEAVMIGDSNYDVESAHSAGIKIIAVTYGFRKRDMLKDADFMIDSFGEVTGVLAEINKFR
ncbi:MAG: HAD-IA family hydrolase [Nitrospirae bacterium]|nr:HAD-IA family hydrolase [Nitrospirota bacterium]